MRFYGNQCLHFARENTTSGTRVSLDFRALRLCDFVGSGIPVAGEDNDSLGRWSVFGFYGVMGPAGEVSRDEWENVLAQTAQEPQPAADEMGPCAAAAKRAAAS